MTRILLASTALIALAGAAAAEGHTGISFTGTASLGFNDDTTGNNVAVSAGDNNVGFYSDLDIVAGFAAELDNGLMAAASLNLDNLGDASTDGTEDGFDYTLSLTSETAGMYYGDTSFAAQNVWASAGDMEADGFSEADGEVVLRGEAAFGGVSTQISYALADSADVKNTGDQLEQLSIGMSADFGGVNVVAAYQEAFSLAADGTAYNTANGDITDADIFGLSVGTSFGGADIRLAYAENSTAGTDSTGIKVAYPLGPVTATAYFVAESAGGDNYGVNLAYENGPVAVALDYQDDQGVTKIGLEGSYDVGNGITAYAGYLTQDAAEDRFYVAGSYDLGSGAELLISYADDSDDIDEDEIGAGDYQRGTTVEVSFDF
ncbi:porin [Octadecabacter sp. G9-8]|uniref:Porin n=1 Tax=Octadecabacter dasysiphoniae TaxID=2909341 RepID=A0ABS9CVR9_9RHOB|nr:porin [Octadecabacter dasysiphoniae]MCF2871330.1 porin [Octadecabacter dasysiphoniae]